MTISANVFTLLLYFTSALDLSRHSECLVGKGMCILVRGGGRGAGRTESNEPGQEGQMMWENLT